MQSLRAKGGAVNLAARTAGQRAGAGAGVQTINRRLHCERLQGGVVGDPSFADPSRYSLDVLAPPHLTSYRGQGEPVQSSSNEPPPSGTSSSSQQPQHERVSDHEYEVRVGRAYELLRSTLPDFMRRGLVEFDEPHHHGRSEEASSAPHSTPSTLLDTIAFRILRARAADDALRSEGFFDSTKHSSGPAPVADENQVYHGNIHFRFCPTTNTRDLTEEEAASLSFSGRSMYFASAHVLRHTLNVLFSDAQVALESIRREKNGRWCGGQQSAPATTDEDDSAPFAQSIPPSTASTPTRADNITVRVGFMGHLRVTGAEHRYTLVFRYDFDSDSGHIVRHTVERVEPAIGRKLWFGLARVWQRVIGQQPADAHPMPSAVPVHSTPPTTLLDRQ